jgi:hypothetical protein
VAVPPAKNELETLEEARAQLETALANDEYWRALRQPASGDARSGAAAARRARNVRLEKALANNELYQAWKHINHAINALNARRPGLEPASKPPTDASNPSPDEIAVEAEPRALPAVRRHDAERLMRRLAAVVPAITENTAAIVTPAAEASGSADEVAVRPEQVQEHDMPRPGAADPPEATVTFVVRETPHPEGASPKRKDGAHEPLNAFRRGHDAGEAEVRVRSDDGAQQRGEGGDAGTGAVPGGKATPSM